jgi:hypothetical protein
MTLLRVLPSANRTASAPSTMTFRGSMAGLHVPLPTLRLHPRGCRRTARGRCGSLFLTSRWTFTTYSSPVLSRRTLKIGESYLGAYGHFNLHGEFDFSPERMVDSIGLWSPKDPSPKGH